MADLLAAQLVRDIPNFPEPGIIFKDITPVLKHPQALREVVELMTEHARSLKPDVIAGIESRGFVFGLPIAVNLGLGFVPIRKLGKLPGEKISEEYALEYGTNTVEIHVDAIEPGQRVVVVDDLLATGGTAAASARLIERLGGTVAGFTFLIELTFLKGRQNLRGYEVYSLIQY
ncbi:MAG: adenine phosphoribosyltransferase [Fimbriimonadales bacterium]|nr:adenine phosphoribosyltransferase [Armatimonadota bacterium]MCX7688713.1 adenine phosphoribosyltransferase [Fimbriimonadales bacterium]